MPYIFGYGSLMLPSSIARTLGREPSVAELTPARVDGYARSWSVWGEALAGSAESPQRVKLIFLNVAEQAGAWCNGVLLPVEEEHLPAFDLRENRYRRVDVRDAVTGAGDAAESHEPVYVYVGHAAYRKPPPEARVASAYEHIIEQSFKIWGKAFEEAYHASTEPHHYPRFDEPYWFDYSF